MTRRKWLLLEQDHQRILEAKTRPISSCLTIDDFAVKDVNQDDTDHMVITKHYPMTVDKDATKYIGLTITWDYEKRTAQISMPGYLKKTFTKFNHIAPKKLQNSLHPHVAPQNGAKVQYASTTKHCPNSHRRNKTCTSGRRDISLLCQSS
jgi:hypothetical protein